MEVEPAPSAPISGAQIVKGTSVKRDFFGRVIDDVRPGSSEGQPSKRETKKQSGGQERGMVWVSFHEGSSTAVRKPITLDEFMRGF